MTRPVLPRTYDRDLSMASIVSMASRRSVSVAYQGGVGLQLPDVADKRAPAHFPAAPTCASAAS